MKTAHNKVTPEKLAVLVECNELFVKSGVSDQARIEMIIAVATLSDNAVQTLKYRLLGKAQNEIAPMLNISAPAVCKILKNLKAVLTPILVSAANERNRKEFENSKYNNLQALDLVFTRTDEETENGSGGKQCGTIIKNLRLWNKCNSGENSKDYYDPEEWKKFTNWDSGREDAICNNTSDQLIRKALKKHWQMEVVR